MESFRRTAQIALFVQIEIGGPRRAAEIDIEQINAGGIVPVALVVLCERLRRTAEGGAFLSFRAPLNAIGLEKTGPVSALIVSLVPPEVDRDNPAVGGVGITDGGRYESLCVGEAGYGISLVFCLLQNRQKQRC